MSSCIERQWPDSSQGTLEEGLEQGGRCMRQSGRAGCLQVCQHGTQQWDAHRFRLLAFSKEFKQLTKQCMALRWKPQRCKKYKIQTEYKELIRTVILINRNIQDSVI